MNTNWKFFALYVLGGGGRQVKSVHFNESPDFPHRFIYAKVVGKIPQTINNLWFGRKSN